jgi:C-terminal processing protease CtpA/Prc
MSPTRVDHTRRARLVRDTKGFGLKVTSHIEERGIRISTILPDGVADRAGTLRPGDVILEVCAHLTHGLCWCADELCSQINGKPMVEASHEDAIAELRANTSIDILVIAAEYFEQRNNVCPSSPRGLGCSG